MYLIPPPTKPNAKSVASSFAANWIAPVVAVLALASAAALPLVATAAAAAAQQRAEEPAKEPGVPLAGTGQPVDRQGDGNRGDDAKPPTASQPAPASPKTAPATQPSAGAGGADAPAPAEPHASYMEPLLAERLAEVAQNRLRERVVTEPMWRQAAALLEAATRLSPRDPRFHRLLIEARLKTGDTDGAIKALSAYRKADPADQVAQVQLIDLYAGRMQTADARLEYLRDILGRSTVAPVVRSHVAALCVPLLLERSRDEAMAMLDEALRLNPISPEALRLRYGMTDANTPPAQRCAVLLSLLRSNPAQPEIIDELGDLLAAAGLTRDATEWYSVALRLYPRMGREYPDGFISDVGSVLLASGQNESLETLLSSYLKARPNDAEAWFIRLVKEKAAGDKGNAQAVDEARQALAARWSNVADRMAGLVTLPDAGAGGAAAPPAGGLPEGPRGPLGTGVPGAAGAAPAAGQSAPDPADAVRRLKAGEAADFKSAFVTAASDLAWLELYFAEKPDAAAKWVGALKEVLPPDSVTVARLDGWLDLLQNRPDDAKAKLSGVADRDPLAALGMIRLAGSDAQGQAQADDAAAKLLADYPHGLVAAIARTELRGRTVKPPERPGAAEVSAALQKFPKDWMEILNQPGAYYKVSADVGKVAHRYGEPLMGRVTITNLTDYDISVGEGGVIRPDLWFDAKLGGLANQAFPGVAYDRISRVIVLPARQGFGQLVRIDQGALGQALAANPSVSSQVLASVVTNPVALADGVGPGPAGNRQSFKALSRAGFPLSQPAQRKRVLTALESGAPAEKMRNLDLVTAYVQLLSAAKEVDEPTRAAGAEFANALTRGRDDAVPAVAAYATYLSGRLMPSERRGDFVERLVNNDNWPARLLGLVVSVGMPPEKQAAVVEKLAQDDPDPVVKSFAAATVDFLRNPPATQPTTQPGTPPGAGGAAPQPAPADQRIGGGDASPIPSGLSMPSEAPAGGAKRGG